DVRVAPTEIGVSVLDRLPIHLEHAVHQVHDPVVRNARPRVRAALVTPVEGQTRVGDLYDEDGLRRMVREVVTLAAGDNKDVGFGLRVVIESNWVLRTDSPAGTEGATQDVGDHFDHRRVR